MPTADYNLLTVALTDSGYFLRLRKGMNLTYGDSYVQVNSTNKTIQNATMDSVEIVERNGWKRNAPKCRLGQWSYEGNKICGKESFDYSHYRTQVYVNDSLNIGCTGTGGGFFRMFYNMDSIKNGNLRVLEGLNNEQKQEILLMGEHCW